MTKDLSKQPKIRSTDAQVEPSRLDLEVTQVSWAGPIPPPEVLRQINEIVPNGAERVFLQFERETAHRHLRERRAQLFPLLDRTIARLVALGFAVGCLMVAAHAVNQNQPWVAAAFGAATIAAGINAFLRIAPQKSSTAPTTTAKKGRSA